ncbi:MAG: carbohydrate ABC transporter permease [Epulopiscium sp.]|nr:carbohydrate ABC transporter permease [Candidatus Epulonipiscium sp.]
MKRSFLEKLFDSILYIIMIFVIAITIYPFINILAISFNESLDSIKGGIYLWPRKFTFENYTEIFKYANIGQALFISISRTVIGTLSGLICSCMIAYTLSRKDYFLRRPIGALLVITMYVSGGMIPEYMLIRQLNLVGKFWVYILPGLVWAFNVIVLRSFMESLPYEIQESAKIDGANDLQIFFKIVMPLCKPAIAVVALFIAVGQWNSWFDTYLYASNKANLTTLQFEMMKILSNLSASQNMAQRAAMAGMVAERNRISPESVRMAITVVATAPIIMIYPFIQKYFVSGMTIGAVKS